MTSNGNIDSCDDIFLEHNYVRNDFSGVVKSDLIVHIRSDFNGDVRSDSVGDVRSVSYGISPRYHETEEQDDNFSELSDSDSSDSFVFGEHSYAFLDVFRIASVNVCGLRSKLCCEDFVRYCQDFDLCFFQETKTDSVDEPYIKNIFDKAGLSIIFRHREVVARHRSGGVAVVFNNNLKNCLHVCTNVTSSNLFFTFGLQNGYNILFGNIYVAPEGSKFFDHGWSEKLERDLVNRLQDDCCKGFFSKTFWLITF